MTQGIEKKRISLFDVLLTKQMNQTRRAYLLYGICIIITGILFSQLFAEKQNALDVCLDHYQQGKWVQARRIAEKHFESPVARLVYSLCLIHDKEHQNLDVGLKKLHELSNDQAVLLELRLEAQLSYTRMIQLLQARGRHQEYDHINVESLYLDLIEKAGPDTRACDAALFLVELYFESHLLNPKQTPASKGFEFLETFIANYPGGKKHLLYLHLYVDEFYIRIFKDYNKSFDHLKQAYQIGITDITTRRECLFKMARLCDLKLNDPLTAEKYYKEFLHLFPNATQTPLVRRYLKELKAKATRE